MKNAAGKHDSWASLLHTVRAPAALVAGVAFALLVPPQTRDIVSGLWEGKKPWHGEAVTFHFVLALLGISAWHWARAALSAKFSLSDTKVARMALVAHAGAPDPKAIVLLPRLMYLAMLVAAVVVTLRSEGTFPAGSWWTALAYAVICAIWVGGLLLLIERLALQQMITGRQDQTAADRCPGWLQWMPDAPRILLRHAPFGPVFATLLVGLALLCFVAGTVGTLLDIGGSRVVLPLALGRLLPGPGALVLALAIGIAPLTLLTFSVERLSIAWTLWGVTIRARWTPIILFLIAWIAYVPTEIHLHQVRVVEAAGAMRPLMRARLPELLATWAAACPGRGALRPVIVAISGGASRAGLWGARVLEEVDATARDAGTGIFALSSVSGGSLGAAGYMTWRAAQPGGSPCGPVNDAVPPAGAMILAMRGDALGPLFAGALFGDIPRSLAGTLLLPAAWAGDVARWMTPDGTTPKGWGTLDARLPRGGDRAAALERAFEANWRDAFARVPGPVGENVPGLDQPYLALSYDLAGHLPRSGVPIWIANGTDQQNGERLLTVPFQASPAGTPAGGADAVWPFDGAKDVLALVGADMPVSAVIDNTARFPLLSPIGELAHVRDGLVGRSSKPPNQIFDGGYFDNGGLQTAMELADWLEHNPPPGREVRPVIVQATADAAGAPLKIDPELPRCGTVFQDVPDESAGNHPDDQLTGPVKGLDGVRRGHSGLILRQVIHHYCSPQRFFHFYLYSDRDHSVPLNWSLSDSIAEYIWKTAWCLKSNADELEHLRKALAELGTDGATSSERTTQIRAETCPAVSR